MKIINFRPLRFNKKLNKIVVASYMQWRNVKTADYNNFKLLINDDYKKFNPADPVYNHKGENLFFYRLHPDQIPIFVYPFELSIEQLFKENDFLGLNWGKSVSYSGRGIDCDCVPCFSHYTADQIILRQSKVEDFDLLTVDTVIKWFGWFLYQLNNSQLKIS